MSSKFAYRRPQRERSASSSSEGPSGGVVVTDLARNFGSVKALDGISFEVPEGKVCSLLGSSGSGKTTTLRLLAGLDKPAGGDIHIGGRHMAGRGVMVPAEKRGVGLLFQAYALWPHMTVADQIAYPLQLRKVPRSEIDHAMKTTAAMLGLEHLLDRFPSQLSGGQQQRVGLARALVFGPRLLLLDEPLSGLDAALRRQTRLELTQLQERVNVTTIYVTHDQEEAMSVSDLVVVMSEGRIVSIAPPRETYDHPSTVFVASFVGGSNLLSGNVAAVSGDEVTIRLSNGEFLTGMSPKPLAVNDPAVAAIKPVDAVVRSDDGTGDNLLNGKISSTTYLGAQIEMAIDIAGDVFRVAIPRWSMLESGDLVRVQLPRDRVTILPPD